MFLTIQVSIGDLNGLFFDLFDPSMLDGLSVEGTEITAEKYDEGDVDNLGGGVNVKGELTQDEGFGRWYPLWHVRHGKRRHSGNYIHNVPRQHGPDA